MILLRLKYVVGCMNMHASVVCPARKPLKLIIMLVRY